MKILLILALILNLAGYGEVDEQGVDTILTQAVIDPFRVSSACNWRVRS